MAHEIDTTTGKAAIAYVGQTPWHGLGQKLDASATVEDWQVAAGLDWRAEKAPVWFDPTGDESGEMTNYKGKDVIYRSDTKKPLSVVSSDYRIVQPSTVLEFFGEVAKAGSFQIETAGSLFEGRRIWALARVGENATVLDDAVAPYLMLATSFDGSMGTTAHFTSIRVVCNNTLQASLRIKDKNRLTIPHSAMFDPTVAAQKLGIVLTTWGDFIQKARKLAAHKMTDSEADTYLQILLGTQFEHESVAEREQAAEKLRNSKGYRRIMALFKGDQKGTGQDAINGTAWGLLNATTEYVDHEVGRLQDNRLDAAWFGEGARVKNTAAQLLTEMVHA